MSAPESRFVKACKALPVDRTPVWFMRQAGRYMPEYRAVRKQYSLIEICKKPEVAAEVTITAAEALGVDAAIIFADLLLPLEVMGLPFHFSPGEGPVIEAGARPADILACALTAPRNWDMCPRRCAWCASTSDRDLPVIGFCGAPFTLASYMIEGGSSRNYRQCQEDDVLVARGLGRAPGQAGRCDFRLRDRAGARRRRCDPGLRQLGGMSERGGLSAVTCCRARPNW